MSNLTTELNQQVFCHFNRISSDLNSLQIQQHWLQFNSIVQYTTRVFDENDQKLLKLKDSMNKSFHISEKNTLQKEKCGIEAEQRSDWFELKKAQDALRKSLEQAKKKIVEVECDLWQRNSFGEDADYPPVDEDEESEIAAWLIIRMIRMHKNDYSQWNNFEFWINFAFHNKSSE